MTTETERQVTRTVDGHLAPVAGTWVLDPTHTTLTFEVRHMMIAKVRGAFLQAEGKIVVPEDPRQTEVEVTVDTASVETGVADRDNHLRSADFFDVENYPKMIYRGKGVEITDDGYVLKGELTIRDVTRPVDLPFEFLGGIVDPYGNPRIAVSASTEIDRTDWNLTWNMALETGGVLLGPKVKIFVDTEATLS